MVITEVVATPAGNLNEVLNRRHQRSIKEGQENTLKHGERKTCATNSVAQAKTNQTKGSTKGIRTTTYARWSVAKSLMSCRATSQRWRMWLLHLT